MCQRSLASPQLLQMSASGMARGLHKLLHRSVGSNGESSAYDLAQGGDVWGDAGLTLGAMVAQPEGDDITQHIHYVVGVRHARATSTPRAP